MTYCGKQHPNYPWSKIKIIIMILERLFDLCLNIAFTERNQMKIRNIFLMKSQNGI